MVSHDELLLILSLIDLTSLSGSESDDGIRSLCVFAQHPAPEIAGGLTVAAVCTFPGWVRAAKLHLKDSPVRVASVTSSFPDSPLFEDKLREEVLYAVGEGADEIDLVMNRDAFLGSQTSKAGDEISVAKQLCRDRVLKVILETSRLGSESKVYEAATLAMQSGADFVKSSTGKKGVASGNEIMTMAKAVKDFYLATGKLIGIKPAGGISTPEQALSCLTGVKNILGEAWMNPRLFRFGASALAQNVVRALKREPGIKASQSY